ncbi:unnamed protein product [Chironomus riparius]|uniref:HAT C-terminal dimerisation domain-containing protein n=1 Tax=Chironomus riparius TaxID=315576 RepID=A0A9P0J9X3_9DIPT|nr:unnamed protein product [Chironomus riparius]
MQSKPKLRISQEFKGLTPKNMTKTKNQKLVKDSTESVTQQRFQQQRIVRNREASQNSSKSTASGSTSKQPTRVGTTRTSALSTSGRKQIGGVVPTRTSALRTQVGGVVPTRTSALRTQVVGVVPTRTSAPSTSGRKQIGEGSQIRQTSPRTQVGGVVPTRTSAPSTSGRKQIGEVVPTRTSALRTQVAGVVPTRTSAPSTSGRPQVVGVVPTRTSVPSTSGRPQVVGVVPTRTSVPSTSGRPQVGGVVPTRTSAPSTSGHLQVERDNEEDHEESGGEEIPENERPNEDDVANRAINLAELNERVKGYFGDYDPSTKSSQCNRCNGKIKGNISHLKDHLTSKHKIIARTLGLEPRNRSKRPREVDEEEPLPKKLKTVSINKTIRELIEFFLSSNISLNCAERLRKVEIVQREFDAYNKVFNRKKLREYILQAAGEDTENDIEDIQEPLKGIYKEIANETKGKLVSIMFDSASRHGRHVFAVSLRYAKGDKVVERTIGVITQHQRQTGANLFNQVELLLRKVGLTINDIYSTCTDQGANMLRAADLAIQAQDAIRICRAIANLEHEEEINIDEAQAAERAEEIDVEHMLRVEAELDREWDEQQQHLHDEQEQEDPEPLVTEVMVDEGALCSKMVCGAHTCQLAVTDVIIDFRMVIAEIRALVKASKRLEFSQVLHAARIRSLRLDVETRWDSLYGMISDVNEFRNQLQEVAFTHEILALNEDAWEFIDEFIQVFTPVHFAMKEFQRADITMSEFYISWVKMELEISGVPLGDEEIKDRLLEALERRKRRFFECDAFIAALLLDPRINWSNNQEDFFGPELLERGMVHIEKIHQVLINRGQVEQLEDQNRDQQNVIYEALDQRLGGGRRGQDQSWQNINQRLTIRQQINRFLAEIRISSGAKLNPQKYWYNKRDEEPEIYKVSQVVYGAAFSQVKVERDFSGFALVLNHLRTLLADNTLNAIMVCKYNLDLLQKIKFF